MVKIRQFSCAHSIGSFGLNDDVFEDPTIHQCVNNWGLNALQKIYETQNFRFQCGFIYHIYEKRAQTTGF